MASRAWQTTMISSTAVPPWDIMAQGDFMSLNETHKRIDALRWDVAGEPI